MTLGQRIAQYRKAAGLSQETLGERVGVSRQAVSKWETNAAAPDMENLIALARIFGVSLAELTETPDVKETMELPDALAPGEPAAAPDSTPPSQRRGWWIALWGFILVVLFIVGSLIYLVIHSTAGQASSIPEPISSEFYFTWQVPQLDGQEWYEYLALGAQDGGFPFGTSLTLTEPGKPAAYRNRSARSFISPGRSPSWTARNGTNIWPWVRRMVDSLSAPP